MYLPQNDISEIVQRQRNQKQELSKALIKNKTKLTQLQQEIQILTQPLAAVDECEVLDEEIKKLRCMCREMLNEIDNLKRSSDPPIEEQRQPLRTAPPPPPHPPPRTRPRTLFPEQRLGSPKSPLSPQSPASQHGQSSMSPNQQLQQEQRQPNVNDTNAAGNPNHERPLWQCNLCTFQNHPDLNKCECCDNVRILPGTVRIVPSRPPPPPPSAAIGSRSAPQTPGTTASASSSVRILPQMLNDYNRTEVANSSSEGNLSEFFGNVII